MDYSWYFGGPAFNTDECGFLSKMRAADYLALSSDLPCFYQPGPEELEAIQIWIDRENYERIHRAMFRFLRWDKSPHGLNFWGQHYCDMKSSLLDRSSGCPLPGEVKEVFDRAWELHQKEQLRTRCREVEGIVFDG